MRLVDIVVLKEILNPPSAPLSTEQKKDLQVKLSLELKIPDDIDLIEVVVNYQMFSGATVYSEISVQNTFGVERLVERFFTNYQKLKLLDPRSAVNPDMLKINKGFANTLTEAAIAHTRAMHLINIKGSTLSELTIPFFRNKVLNEKKSIITIADKQTT